MDRAYFMLTTPVSRGEHGGTIMIVPHGGSIPAVCVDITRIFSQYFSFSPDHPRPCPLKMAAFKQLVRFLQNGKTYYGDLVDSSNGKFTVQRLDGNPFDKLIPTNEHYTVDSVSLIP